MLASLLNFISKNVFLKFSLQKSQSPRFWEVFHWKKLPLKTNILLSCPDDLRNSRCQLRSFGTRNAFIHLKKPNVFIYTPIVIAAFHYARCCAGCWQAVRWVDGQEECCGVAGYLHRVIQEGIKVEVARWQIKQNIFRGKSQVHNP